MFDKLFGNLVATCCFLYIVNYGNGHIRSIARTFGFSPGQVKPQLDKFEQAKVLSSEMIGNVRVFIISKDFPARTELVALIEKMLASLDERIIVQFFRERRRPVNGVPARTAQKQKKRELWERERGVCQICSKVDPFWEMDHRVPICEGGRDELDNLRTLCPECHGKETAELMRRLFSEYSYSSPFNLIWTN